MALGNAFNRYPWKAGLQGYRPVDTVESCDDPLLMKRSLLLFTLLVTMTSAGLAEDLSKMNLYELHISELKSIISAQSIQVVSAGITMTEMKYEEALKECRDAENFSSQIEELEKRWTTMPSQLFKGAKKSDYQATFDEVRTKAVSAAKSVDKCKSEASSALEGSVINFV